MSAPPSALPACLVAHGASCAAALLDRATPAASLADLAAVAGYLQCHPALYAFAAGVRPMLRQALAGAWRSRE